MILIFSYYADSRLIALIYSFLTLINKNNIILVRFEIFFWIANFEFFSGYLCLVLKCKFPFENF